MPGVDLPPTSGVCARAGEMSRGERGLLGSPWGAQFPRLIIQNFNLAYDLWVFEFNLAYDPWVFEFTSCAQFTIVRILHCDSHPTGAGLRHRITQSP